LQGAFAGRDKARVGDVLHVKCWTIVLNRCAVVKFRLLACLQGSFPHEGHIRRNEQRMLKEKRGNLFRVVSRDKRGRREGTTFEHFSAFSQIFRGVLFSLQPVTWGMNDGLQS